MLWNDNDLKDKENKSKRTRGKWLEERENHPNKGKERGKDKRGGSFTKKGSSSISSFSFSNIFSFLFHYAELISLFVGGLM